MIDSQLDPWSSIHREVMEQMDPDGDFAKKHVLNGAIFDLVGDVAGRKVLDAGAGQGYLSRKLAAAGAQVVAVEPAKALHDYAVEREAAVPQGIELRQQSLADLPDLDAFDLVVCSMVLISIDDWLPALRACVDSLRAGGRLIVALEHPCFEELGDRWSEGAYRAANYFVERRLDRPVAPDFHRTVSTYVNAIIGCGCRITALSEPQLTDTGSDEVPAGAEAMTQLPAFLLIASVKT